MIDLRFALRLLAKQPGLTLVVILSLALGIGANTVVLSWIRGVLFNAIPGVEDPGRLVVVCMQHQSAGLRETLSQPDLRSLADESGLFEGITGSQMSSFTMTVGAETEWVWAEIPMANYFDVLGVKPVLGEFFRPSDDLAAPPRHAVVISHRLWQRRFAGTPEVVGQAIEIDRQPAVIIGVAPPEFLGTMGGLRFDAWIAPALTGPFKDLEAREQERGWRWIHAVARLDAGMSKSQARARLRVVGDRLAREHRDSNETFAFILYPLWQSPWGGQGKFLPLLQVLGCAAILLLALITANVANLLLARAHRRETEMAVRLALGAGPWRLLRQVFLESLSLALPGGCLGVALALNGTRLLESMLPPTYLPLAVRTPLDAWVLSGALLLTLLTALLFGLAPAWQACRSPLPATLKEGSRGLVTRARHVQRAAFVVSEIALAMMLLIAMGLCLRSLENTRHLDIGVQPDGVTLAGFRLNHEQGDTQRVLDFYRRLQEEAATLPGIDSVALSSWLPLGFEGYSSSNVGPEGYDRSPGEDMSVGVAIISQGYFKTVGTPLVAGRDLRAGDDGEATPAMVINEAFAQRYFHGRDPLGLRVRFRERDHIVVGVVATGKYRELNEPPTPWLFVSHLQHSAPELVLVLHGAAPFNTLKTSVESLATRLDPGIRPFAVTRYRDYVGAAFLVAKVAAALLSVLGGTALFLAVLGIYAVVSQQAQQRTRELAIRMALGAQRGDILALVMKQGGKMISGGVLLGLALAWPLAGSMTSVLHGVKATDPLTLLVTPLVLVLAAALASYLPARRATRMEPSHALRCE